MSENSSINFLFLEIKKKPFFPFNIFNLVNEVSIHLPTSFSSLRTRVASNRIISGMVSDSLMSRLNK